MYGWDTLVLLKHYLDEGLSKTAIAQRLGVSQRAVYQITHDPAASDAA